MLTKENLRGVWARVPTSWDATGKFDKKAFAINVARLGEAGVHSIYTTGTAGKFYALSDDEFGCLVKVFAGVTRGPGAPTQVGGTGTDIRSCLWRAQAAAEHGCDGLQTALPFWVRLNDDEVVQFFSDLSPACPSRLPRRLPGTAPL